MLSNNIAIRVIILLYCCSIQSSAPTYTRYKIGIELPFLKEEYVPSMNCFYKGQQFNSSGCIEIILSSQEREFYLLISKAESLEIPQDCNINALYLNKQHPYRIWLISSYYEHDTSTNSAHLVWSAHEKTSQSVQQIPHNTIIVLWDNPDDVSHIKKSKSSTTGPFICLPTLVFQTKLSLQNFKQKENYMHAASVDLKFNHVLFCETTKVNQVANQTISIPTPTRQT